MARVQLITHGFPQADGSLDATADWDSINDSNHGGLDVATNKFRAPYAFPSVSVWVGANAGSIVANCYASIVISGIGVAGSNDEIGVVGRALVGTGSTDANYYLAKYVEAASDSLSLWKYINGTLTQLGSTVTSVDVANGDRLAIRCFDSSIILEHNETPVAGLTQTDTALTLAGAVGVYGKAGSVELLRGDDFDAGNYTSASQAPRSVQQHRTRRA